MDETEDPAAGFDRLLGAISDSVVFAASVRASSSGLPDWLVPFSTITSSLLETIAEALHIGEDETLVDIGCGWGGASLWVAERLRANVIGIDFSKAATRRANALAARRNMQGRAEFRTADATSTGLAESSASGVMSIDALMFVDSFLASAEIARVVRPGGIVVATAAESLVEPFMPTLVRDYRPIFEDAGFTILRHEEVDERQTRRLSLYRQLLERSADLRDELGDIAETLLEEARNGLERDRNGTNRVREILLVAERWRS